MSLLESVWIDCPYCGEPNELVIDTSIPQQSYVEDCFVCCRPIQLRVSLLDGEISVAVRSEDELF